MTLAQILGERIKAARLDSGLAQNDVAKALGVSQASYSNIEVGRTALTVETLLRLVEILGRPVSYFLDNSISSDISSGDQDHG